MRSGPTVACAGDSALAQGLYMLNYQFAGKCPDYAVMPYLQKHAESRIPVKTFPSRQRFVPAVRLSTQTRKLRCAAQICEQ